MKIAIAGYGIEGQASYRYFSADKNNEITIVDQAQPSGDMPKGVKSIVGQDAFNNLTGFDKVIRTPALPPEAIKTDGQIWSATNEFFAKCPAPIIGVTGTKGKGTTASLITSILNKAGKKVWLVGNIGIAALEVLPDITKEDIVVYELSSFQLWDLKYSPQTAVILFIEPEHLNIHKNLEEYLQSKMNITKWQTAKDFLVYYKHNTLIDAKSIKTKAKKIPYQDESYAHVKEEHFYYGQQKLGPIKELKLLGDHNLDNACAAIDAAKYYVKNPKTIMAGLADFEGLPHRLKLINQVEGVSYYDDSIATTPKATLAAINAIKQPKHLILGGSSKGANHSELAKRMTEKDILSAFLMGVEAQEIAKELDSVGFINYKIIPEKDSLKNVVYEIHQQAAKGEAVLLSPAAASFGQFKDYVDRGNQFIKAVEDL